MRRFIPSQTTATTLHPMTAMASTICRWCVPGFMLLAFWVDQTQQRCGALFQAVWTQLGRQRLLWERMSALGSTDALESRRPRLEALVDGLKKPQPSVAFDASSALQRCPGRPWTTDPDDPP